MKFRKKMLKFITTHEKTIKKVIDWSVSIGSLVFLIFRVIMAF